MNLFDGFTQSSFPQWYNVITRATILLEKCVVVIEGFNSDPFIASDIR